MKFRFLFNFPWVYAKWCNTAYILTCMLWSETHIMHVYTYFLDCGLSLLRLCIFSEFSICCIFVMVPISKCMQIGDSVHDNQLFNLVDTFLWQCYQVCSLLHQLFVRSLYDVNVVHIWLCASDAYLLLVAYWLTLYFTCNENV